ncbi:hypothetical protein DWX51_07815 [Bacteroides uniformis]|uniref:Transmembrane protein n=1 Tax=Bacteroides uniformis TaxID=820 RepID=A0A412B820_BACUN|nr:hypothetical protein DXD58_01280 [Bacteroides sp. D20]RGQ49229.1 hypothetical protein DWY92_15375 [Bacteroides uniformis]RGT14828.1 hypothetical protein DWX51_07815 [Bacteroides uniformis]RHC06528.1 hypothetical protein DW861_04555 [Bacteroides uniformis]RHE05378.1 hypothetical protein DW771_08380 [Bacteroides uniformis]
MLIQSKSVSLPRPPFWVGYGTDGSSCTNKTFAIRSSPFLFIFFFYFIVYSIIGSSLFTSVARIVPFCSFTEIP